MTKDAKNLIEDGMFWVNLIAVVAAILQAAFGWIVTPEIQIIILGLLNWIISLIVGHPVIWKRER